MNQRIIIILLVHLSFISSKAQNVYPTNGPTVLDDKIGFSTGLSDGTKRGIWLWRTADSNHVIYSADPSGTSPKGNNVVGGLWDNTHRMRFRTSTNQGFLFENKDEIALVDIDADNGNFKSIGIAHFSGSGDNYFAGNVGIGISSPTKKLEVRDGDIRILRTSGDAQLQLTDNGVRNWFVRVVDGANRFSIADNATEFLSVDGTNGNVGIGTTSPTTKLSIHDSGSSLDFFGDSGGNAYIRSNGGEFRFRPEGATTNHLVLNSAYAYFKEKIGIGTSTFGSHKLAVEGSIGAREVKVEASGWSDFVFEKDYDLRPLEEVEQYITKNQHLPEIPSEAEVTENGINLGEMNAKLLQKIEELTLYLIEQNKENKEQRKLIEDLQKEISDLKQ